MNPVLQLADLHYTYPSGNVPALAGVSLSMHAGECVCVTGPSGCGKTTLLLAVMGLIEGQVGGAIRLAEKENGAAVGMVFQNADTQLLCTTVEDEVAFGPQNLSLPVDAVRRRVKNALMAVGLAGLEKKNVEHLSAGQKHRLTIASVLSMGPDVMLLDEPTGQLDIPGREKLAEILGVLKKKGHTFLVTDHDLTPYRGIADRFVLMSEGRVAEIHADFRRVLRFSSPAVDAGRRAVRDGGGVPAVDITDLHLTDRDGSEILRSVRLRLEQGECVHLFGRNGAGKSSLLGCMVGILTPDSGRIHIAGIGSPRPEVLLGRVGFLFQNPQRQLFENTTYEEVAFSLKRMGLPSTEIHQRVMASLELCEASHLSERAPLTLSFGEQHRVALASVVAPEPDVLLFDEPFSGLDFEQRHRVLRTFAQLRERRGTTILIASHGPLPDSGFPDRTLILEEGRIEEA
jgi:energy-coupling factor transporter ATP-binding protein EcfA2